ncbi:hypothetical protein NC651_006071 [Populus alba x Populus x berolinensis]|nr:hypothetical protein NC651_006071 [Populus alba x Populus x berolinensis]
MVGGWRFQAAEQCLSFFGLKIFILNWLRIPNRLSLVIVKLQTKATANYSLKGFLLNLVEFNHD